MKIHPLSVSALASVAAILVSVSHASADSLVYDDSVNYLNRTYAPGNDIEFGDEIFLDGGPNFTITEFKFETFVSDPNILNQGGGGVTADNGVNLRLRLFALE